MDYNKEEEVKQVQPKHFLLDFECKPFNLIVFTICCNFVIAIVTQAVVLLLSWKLIGSTITTYLVRQSKILAEFSSQKLGFPTVSY